MHNLHGCFRARWNWKIIIFIATWKRSLICSIKNILILLISFKQNIQKLSCNHCDEKTTQTQPPRKRIKTQKEWPCTVQQNRMCCVQFFEMECSTHKHQNTYNTYRLSQWQLINGNWHAFIHCYRGWLGRQRCRTREVWVQISTTANFFCIWTFFWMFFRLTTDLFYQCNLV